MTDTGKKCFSSPDTALLKKNHNFRIRYGIPYTHTEKKCFSSSDTENFFRIRSVFELSIPEVKEQTYFEKSGPYAAYGDFNPVLVAGARSSPCDLHLGPLCHTRQFNMVWGWTHKEKRDYFRRVDPFNAYSEKKFVARYRLSKEVCKVLIKDYVATRSHKILRGKHAVPHSLRVCIYRLHCVYLYMHCPSLQISLHLLYLLRDLAHASDIYYNSVQYVISYAPL